MLFSVILISLINIITLNASNSNIAPGKDAVIENYGYKSQSLFKFFTCSNASTVIVSYPNRDKPLSQLPPPDFELQIGQNLVNSLLTTDIVHAITDRLRNTALPIEEIQTVSFDVGDYLADIGAFSKLGKLSLNLQEFRLDGARILSGAKAPRYVPTDPAVTFSPDHYGGALRDNRKRSKAYGLLRKALGLDKLLLTGDQRGAQVSDIPNRHYSNTSTILFIKNDRLRVSITNLNLAISAKLNLKGSMLGVPVDETDKVSVQVRKAAIMFDVGLVEHDLTKGPAIKIMAMPTVYMDDIKFQISGSSFNQKTLSMVQNGFKNMIRDISELIITKFIVQEASTIGDMAYDILEHTLISSVNNISKQSTSSTVMWPRLAIEDLRWRVEQYRIVIRANLRHIPTEERKEMTQLWAAWKSQHKLTKESCKNFIQRRTIPQDDTAFMLTYTKSPSGRQERIGNSEQ